LRFGIAFALSGFALSRYHVRPLASLQGDFSVREADPSLAGWSFLWPSGGNERRGRVQSVGLVANVCWLCLSLRGCARDPEMVS
jgi:hypothetical protein